MAKRKVNTHTKLTVALISKNTLKMPLKISTISECITGVLQNKISIPAVYL